MQRTVCVLLSLLFASGCGKLPGAETGAGNFLGAGVAGPETSLSGYIAISESTNRTVMLFDGSMGFVRYLYQGPSGVAAEIPLGINLYDASNIMVLIDGNDRVIKNSLMAPTGLGTVLVTDVTNLVTATRGSVARLSGGDILIVEGGTNFVERFTSTGVRQTTGWPLASLTAPGGIDAINVGGAAGGFVHCAITSDQVRSHSSTGATLFTAVTVAAHDFIDCVAHTDGRIAVALNGATDRVRIYADHTFASFCDYSSAILLVNPLALDFKPNGNVLVWDGTNRHLLEINSACTLVATYSNAYVSPVAVTDIMVIP